MNFERSGITFSVSDQIIEQLVLAKLRSDDSRRLSFATALGTLPRIGAEIAEYGGVFAGVIRGADGQPDYMLIVGPEAPEKLEWQKAIDWAHDLTNLGYSDYELPLRKEQSVLFGNVPELFKKESYWSQEQHAGYSDNAWGQYFDDGHQGHWHKDSDGRARAVRRLPIY